MMPITAASVTMPMDDSLPSFAEPPELPSWQLCANTAEKVGLGAERQKLLATQRVQQFLAEGMHRYWLGLPTKPWLGQTLHQ
jgi:hypothetical protein